MAALPAKGLGLSGPVDRALGLPEKICGIHRADYDYLNERELENDKAFELVAFTIIECCFLEVYVRRSLVARGVGEGDTTR
jgi:hypothetical protein